MPYKAILTSLADPTRRAILDRLRAGPLPVGKIAEGLPVTRPAVSQHLRMMREAGLVTVTPRGTRNLYQLAPGGAAPLVGWLGDLRPAPAEGSLSLHVRMSPGECWSMFRDDLSTWWPVARLSVSAMESGALPLTVGFEGDRLQETTLAGTTHVWATLADEAPPECLVLDWQLETPGRVTVRFAPESGGTRVAVEAPEEAQSFWEVVLIERFGSAARASLSNF